MSLGCRDSVFKAIKAEVKTCSVLKLTLTAHFMTRRLTQWCRDWTLGYLKWNWWSPETHTQFRRLIWAAWIFRKLTPRTQLRWSPSRSTSLTSRLRRLVMTLFSSKTIVGTTISWKTLRKRDSLSWNNERANTGIRLCILEIDAQRICLILNSLMQHKQKIFKKFKYRDQEFAVGDVCRFYIEQQTDLVGKITQVLSTDPTHKDFAKLKV